MKIYFSARPETTPVGKWDGRNVREFTDPWPFHIIKDDGTWISCSIPKGFQVDGASVPHAPFVWYLFGDRGEIASYMHDYFYRKDSCPVVKKDIADSVFLAAMQFTNDPEWDVTKNMMYKAVVWFGEGSYHKKLVTDKLCGG
ncbi:MAG: DUF1353 domain-containing protein [Smithella sp.]